MTDFAIARPFLLAEIEALAPFDSIGLIPSNDPLHAVEVTRLEGGGLEVRVPGRAPILRPLEVPVRGQLHERGFRSEDPADPTEPWSHAAASAEEALDLARRLLVEVFGEKPDVALDVTHASHRAEHEAHQKLAAVRERVENVLKEMTGRVPEQDADGDYQLEIGTVRVQVAPRASLTGPVVVRVFAITNVGVNVTPELGLLLARLNFGLMFGRFALDAEHAAIWFDETLLGEQFTDEELRFTIGVVASTADEWDERLKQMFGGATGNEIEVGAPSRVPPPTKPGGGGYI